MYLAGDFNDWKPAVEKMDGPDAEGFYVKELELPAGRYEYKFVINGTEWRQTPATARSRGSTATAC